MKRMLLAVLIGLTAQAGVARADDLSDVVDRYIAWRGGAAFEALRTIHEKGRVQTPEAAGTVESWEDRSGRSRADSSLGALSNREVATPSGGYTLNASGQTEALSNFHRENARRSGLIDFGQAIRGEGGAKVSLRPSEQLDGRTWAVVRITFGDSQVFDLFIDPKTGEEAGLRMVVNRSETFQARRDWRMVDGVRMPFESVQRDAVDGRESVLKLDEVDINARLEDALFAPPAAQHHALFADGVGATDWIRFEFFQDERIFIPARIGGEDLAVMLDSGAESTLIDKRLAARLGLKPESRTYVRGTGGRADAEVVSGVDIQIGDLTFKNLTVIVVDMAATETFVGHSLPVILGKEAFNELIVAIDFASQSVAFVSPANFEPPAGATMVPAPLVDGLRAVPVSIDGRAPVLFTFDLGNSVPLIVYTPYATQASLLAGRPQSITSAGAIGGFHDMPISSIRRLTFAGHDFKNVPALFPTTVAEGPDETEGDIGLPILSRFRVIADYGRDRIFVVPYADIVDEPFFKNRFGFDMNALQDGRVVISAIDVNSPAATAGLKVDDEVAAINGKPIAQWNTEGFDPLWATPSGETVVITLKGGATRRLTVGEYY